MTESHAMTTTSRRSRVAFAAGYVLIAESAFAALAAFVVASHLEAGFQHVLGGFRAAIATPGAPQLVEGLLPFVFQHSASWLAALVALAALHALVAPFLQLAWLAALAPDASQRALRTAAGSYLAALRLRVLLLVPALFALVSLVILVAYCALVLRSADERTRDLVLVAALLCGAGLFTPLRVLADLGHAALVDTVLAGETPSARQALDGAIRGFSLAAYARWAGLLLLGVGVLAVGTLGSLDRDDALALLVTQVAAYLRYVLRGAWLASALATVSSARAFGSRTRKSAPPPASSALPAEMVPP